jgi:hypothetical protein
MTTNWGLLIAIWLLCAAASLAIGVAKGRSWGEWLAFGAVFGILGVIVVAVMPRGKSK